MDIDKKIEDLRKEFDEKINKLKKEYETEKSEKWILEEGESFYYLNDKLDVIEDLFESMEYDKETLKYHKIFKTYKEAQEYADYLKVRKEYSYEFSKEEWEDEGLSKYSIYYDYGNNDIDIEIWGSCRNLNQIHFKTEALAQAFIDKYRKQILKFEFEIEEE